MLKVQVLCRVLLLLLGVSGCLAEVDSADQRLLTAAGDRVDIRSPGAKPFQLDADFTAQINIPQDGHLTWKWVARDLWSQEITMGDYRQLNVRKGDTLYISRNAPFPPLRITELQDLLDVLSVEPDYWQVKKAKHQVQGGVKAECIEIRARSVRDAWNPKRTLCIYQTTQEVWTYETKAHQEYRAKE